MVLSELGLRCAANIILRHRFSKRAIGQFEYFVREQVDYISDQLAQYKETGKVLAINKVWNAYAGDVITQYAFGINYKHLESEEFKETFHDAFMAVSEFGHTSLQFPWITPVSVRSTVLIGVCD